MESLSELESCFLLMFITVIQVFLFYYYCSLYSKINVIAFHYVHLSFIGGAAVARQRDSKVEFFSFSKLFEWNVHI